MKTRVVHKQDPMRYPNVQKRYEDMAKKSFPSVKLFGDIVQEMSNIIKSK